ncbi:hypothetical protein MAPG_02393 [Magnaporthiopsis poae ATCC 64411]|uniref:Uncharacterized protein n=1 Tax=Magnaporthiopsis poae (strain ATCC 64411 / 73-15) TaxID=644358 RepID=A0A0C4DR87_MAGP6|nr:hypothetical protein MAPG_02393 [Magnaporthiopsis poae ATCC 64411]
MLAGTVWLLGPKLNEQNQLSKEKGMEMPDVLFHSAPIYLAATVRSQWIEHMAMNVETFTRIFKAAGSNCRLLNMNRPHSALMPLLHMYSAVGGNNLTHICMQFMMCVCVCVCGRGRNYGRKRGAEGWRQLDAKEGKRRTDSRR